MPQINEAVNPNIVLAADYIFAYRLVKVLYQPFEETEAFRLGIIDANGKKIKDPETSSEKAAYSPFMRLCFRIKSLVNKVPGGSSKMGSLAAAYLLLKEEEIMKIAEFLNEQSLDKVDEAVYQVKHDGVPSDHSDKELVSLFSGKKDVINHTTKYEKSAADTAKMLKGKGFNNVRVYKNGKLMEETELDEELKNIGDLVKKSHDKIKGKIKKETSKSPEKRKADIYKDIESRYKNIGKFITKEEVEELDEEGVPVTSTSGVANPTPKLGEMIRRKKKSKEAC